MAISLDSFKRNKEITKDMSALGKLMAKTYPTKTWGWIGVTCLLFSQLAIENYLADNEPQEEFYPTLKRMIWQFQEQINEIQLKKGINKNE